MKKQTRNTNFWGIKSRDKVMPNKLFADTDRDGVPNVFDCRPFNKRRQDEEAVKIIRNKDFFTGKKTIVIVGKKGRYISEEDEQDADEMRDKEDFELSQGRMMI